MEPMRVLHVVTDMNRGGIETMLMNYHRVLDRSAIQFDYLTHRPYEGDFGEEIHALGGRIYHLPKLNPISPQYMSRLDAFFGEHGEYRIVHSHLNSLSAIILKAAKRHHVPVRIAHAHTTNWDIDWKYPIRTVLRRFIPGYATRLVACSHMAGEKMFPGKVFIVLHSAIDAAQFSYDEQLRRAAREEFGFRPGNLVLGTVSRFFPQKNPNGVIQIFARVQKRRPDARLLWVGDGDLRAEAQNTIERLGLSDAVTFTGVRPDVCRLLQAMDIFIFPSLYEGLGLAAVEAQAAGLPTFCSDAVPRETGITPLCRFLPLNDIDRWAEEILSTDLTRSDTRRQIIDAGYDVRGNAQWLQDFYMELYHGSETETDHRDAQL